MIPTGTRSTVDSLYLVYIRCHHMHPSTRAHLFFLLFFFLGDEAFFSASCPTALANRLIPLSPLALSIRRGTPPIGFCGVLGADACGVGGLLRAVRAPIASMSVSMRLFVPNMPCDVSPVTVASLERPSPPLEKLLTSNPSRLIKPPPGLLIIPISVASPRPILPGLLEGLALGGLFRDAKRDPMLASPGVSEIGGKSPAA